jgi:hypothetical protein
MIAKTLSGAQGLAGQLWKVVEAVR